MAPLFIKYMTWYHSSLKGKLGDFFLSAQSFYRPQTKTSYKIQFSPKSPKVGQKLGQRVQNSQNKNQVSSDLLGESTNSVIRAAGGIHQFCHPTCWGNPLIGNFSCTWTPCSVRVWTHSVMTLLQQNLALNMMTLMRLRVMRKMVKSVMRRPRALVAIVCQVWRKDCATSASWLAKRI